jgi:hypothetical protein
MLNISIVSLFKHYSPDLIVKSPFWFIWMNMLEVKKIVVSQVAKSQNWKMREICWEDHHMDRKWLRGTQVQGSPIRGVIHGYPGWKCPKIPRGTPSFHPCHVRIFHEINHPAMAYMGVPPWLWKSLYITLYNCGCPKSKWDDFLSSNLNLSWEYHGDNDGDIARQSLTGIFKGFFCWVAK